MLEPVYSKKQVAERYGVCLRTVDSWISTTALEHMKLGRRVVITTRALLDFEKRLTVKAFQAT